MVGQVFQLLLTTTVLELMGNQPKLFASQKGVSLDLCLEEMQAFIGLNIAMGVMHLPQVKDYWCTSKILATPWFPSVMSRDRFFLSRDIYILQTPPNKRKKEK